MVSFREKRATDGVSMQDIYKTYIRHGFVMCDEGADKIVESIKFVINDEFGKDEELTKRICRAVVAGVEQAYNSLECA